MAQKELTTKLSGSSENSIFYNEQRLKSIEYALAAMKEMNKGFLKKYELSEVWHKVNLGLIKHNMQISLQNLVEFKLCESNKEENSYFNYFSKKPITMCYNKFIDQRKFDQTLSYNLILYYDAKTKKGLNWNNLQHTILANVRALRISGICKENDRSCLKKQIQVKVLDKERFKGKIINNMEQIILQGLKDTTPISQINNTNVNININTNKNDSTDFNTKKDNVNVAQK